MKNTTNRMTTKARPRQMTRREFVGGALARRRGRRRTGVSARPESERQAEHRVHRLRRSRQRQPQRAHHRAGTRRSGREAAARQRRASRAASGRERRRALRREPARGRRRGAAVPEGEEVQRSPPRLRPPERLRRRRRLHRRAHACVRDLPGADARQARLLREAAHLQHLGSAAHPRDRREVSEAVDADGQPGPRVAGPAHDQGNPHDRRDRSGARSPRLGGSRVGTAGRGVGREVRQAARVLQRHPDRRSVQGRDADSRRPTTSICGSDRRRRGRSTRRTSPARAGIAGGISATAR